MPGLTIQKRTHIPGGALGFEVSAASPELALALAQDAPFPAAPQQLGAVTLAAETEAPVSIGRSSDGSVRFGAKAAVRGAAGVFDDAPAVAAALTRDGLAERLLPGLVLPAADGNRYLLMSWGYDLAATASGSVALAPGVAPKFSVEAQRAGAFGVLRLLPRHTGARSAIASALESWMLPGDFGGVDDLTPGTWILCEVEGNLKLTAGIQYGVEYSWVRQAGVEGLSGDIGLRLETGARASLGLSTGGQYAVVLSRESLDPAVKRMRLRVYKLSTRGLQFAMTAGASVQPVADLVPGNFDDFVKGLLGTHGLQVLEDLRQWTDPGADLARLLGGVGIDYARGLLREITGVDAETALTEAHARLHGLLGAWQQLPHTLAARLYAIVERRRPEVPGLRASLRRLADDPAAVARARLAQLLERVDLFDTPIGEWIEAAATDGALALVADQHALDRVKDLARRTLAVLDGSVVESMLSRLQTAISARLGLDRLDDVVDQASFENLDAWLKARLSAFLGHTLDLEGLLQVREAVHGLLGSAETLYAKTREALSRTYEFELAASYQRARSSDALVDVEFDFVAAAGREETMATVLRQAVRGDIDLLLTRQLPGVTLHAGVLTHGIKRQTHAEVSLPFANASITHVTTVAARMSTADTSEGRVLLYALDASDEIAKRRYDSRLALGLDVRVGSGVRVFSPVGRHSYTLRQAVRDMKVAHLEHEIGPYVDKYFPDAFAAPGTSFSTWVHDFDSTVEAILHNGQDQLGDTLIALNVVVPGEAIAVWATAPAKGDERYYDMSLRLQETLRELVPFCYFQDADRYDDGVPTAAILLYSALVPRTGNPPKGDLHFDWRDRSVVKGIVEHPQTRARLAQRLATAAAYVKGIGKKGTRFERQDAQQVVDDALSQSGSRLLEALLRTESVVIHGAAKAGVAMAQFREKAAGRPAEALEELSKFGAELTDAFNDDVRSLYAADQLSALGTMLLLEAGRALGAPDQRPSALLEVTVVRDHTRFKDFLAGARPPASEVVVPARLVQVG